jgi:hypothetical protein
VEVELLLDLSLVAGALELSATDHLGQVEQGAGHGRAGDGGLDRRVAVDQRDRAVDPQAGPRATVAYRDRDVDLGAAVRAQAVQSRRRAV